MTVFMSTHVLEAAEEVCHRAGILDQGRMAAAGTMAQLRASHPVQAAAGLGLLSTNQLGDLLAPMLPAGISRLLLFAVLGIGDKIGQLFLAADLERLLAAYLASVAKG